MNGQSVTSGEVDKAQKIQRNLNLSLSVALLSALLLAKSHQAHGSLPF